MKRIIRKEEIDEIFDHGYTDQTEVALALYRLAFPDWDDIEEIDSWPLAGKELALYVMKRFMKFDREHHPTVINGGLWMNKGWSSDEKLEPWELDTSGCHLTYTSSHGKAA